MKCTKKRISTVQEFDIILITGSTAKLLRDDVKIPLVNKRNFQVSWIRSSDLHILTFGNIAFSSDARFSPQHTSESEAWTLKLEDARKSDSARYECQINTEPKIMYAVQLFVRGKFLANPSV